MTTLTLTTMTTAPIQGTGAIRDGAYETRDFFLLLIRTPYAYPLRRGVFYSSYLCTRKPEVASDNLTY